MNQITITFLFCLALFIRESFSIDVNSPDAVKFHGIFMKELTNKLSDVKVLRRQYDGTLWNDGVNQFINAYTENWQDIFSAAVSNAGEIKNSHHNHKEFIHYDYALPVFGFDNRTTMDEIYSCIDRITDYRASRIFGTTSTKLISAEVFERGMPDPHGLDTIVIYYEEHPTVVWYNEDRLGTIYEGLLMTEKRPTKWYEITRGWSLFIDVTKPMQLMVNHLNENIREHVSIERMKDAFLKVVGYMKN